MNQPNAFVITSLAPAHSGTYKLIKRTFEQLGWVCLRADELPGSTSIVRAMIERIIGATLVVVDLTALDGDALYSLGVAHAFGNNVLTLFSGPREALPQYLGNYPPILYENSFDGAQQLKAALRQAVAALPEWGGRPNNPVQDFLPPERRSGAPASPAPLPATPAREEALRELGYHKAYAEAVRKRLHYVQIAAVTQGPGGDPSLALEVDELEGKLRELRAAITRLEQQAS